MRRTDVPDICMCTATEFQCDQVKTCYRNERSGTEADPYRQAYFKDPPMRLVLETYTECDYHWPVNAGSE